MGEIISKNSSIKGSSVGVVDKLDIKGYLSTAPVKDPF